VDRRHRLFRQELSVEHRDSTASLFSRECVGGRKSEGNKGGEVGGRQVAEVAAEGNYI